MKKILITGGAGFIGSHLSKFFLDRGDFVICLDNFFTGSKENIKDFSSNPNFKLVEIDITEQIDDIISKITDKLDYIYNLACPASPPHYQFDPIKTAKTSVIGILNMLELAKKYNSTILQASTSEVYGNPLVHPQVESYFGNVNPIGIRSCYDEGKRIAETLMMDYNRQHNIKTRIIRIFNTYGPNMDENDGRVVSNFIVQALKNEDITIYGDGSQTRSFCYIDDLIRAIVLMGENKKDFVGPVNLGNPSERSVLDFAKLIQKMTKTKSKIVFKDLPKDDPIKRQPNISLAKEVLKWEPKIDIEIGLKKTIEYFKKKIEG